MASSGCFGSGCSSRAGTATALGREGGASGPFRCCWALLGSAFATCDPGTSRPTGASRSPRPSEHSWTSPATSPSMPPTPRSPRHSCASSSRSKTSGPAPPATSHGYPTRLHRRSHVSSAGLRRLLAELDGYAYHAHRRAFETDRERDIVLAAAGWQTVRITDHQLNAKRAATAERHAAQQPRTMTLPRFAARNQIGVPTASVTCPSCTRRP